MTYEEAIAQILPVLDHLRAEEAKRAEIERTSEDWSQDPPHWDLARELAEAILDAANRDGYYGCRLCRS